MRHVIKNICVLLILGLTFSACSIQRSAISGDKRAYGYSWDQEKQIGQEADPQIQQQYGLYDNEELQLYVTEIGQKMLAVSHMNRADTPKEYAGTEFNFRVLDSPVVNAFALPGGYIYVTRGLLSHLENEAQLSVVLGHEIGHVIARHASQRAFEQQMGQIALIGGAIAGEALGLPGGDILGMGSQLAQLLFLSYSRDDERESDQLGVEYASMQHYKASEGAEFFKSLDRMAKQSGQNLPNWQSTHPDPAERAVSIPELAEHWRAEGYEQTIENTDDYMGVIDNIIYGENPREGFSRNGTFYHPDLRFYFTYPEDWELINQRSLVAIVNKDQDAISIMTLDGESSGAEASVNAFLMQEGITTIAKSDVYNNGLTAFRAEASGQTEDGTELKFFVYAVVFEGAVYRFLNYTTKDKYNTYSINFDRITRGFSELSDPDILNIKPTRLQVAKTQRSGIFSAFISTDLKDLSIPITPEDLAIANQMELDEFIQKGRWLKLPVQ